MLLEKITLLKSLVKRQVLLNAVKSYSSYGLSILTKKTIICGSPPLVMIEPTNYCNLQCPLCPSGNGTMKRPRGYMEFQLFKKIIDEIQKTTAIIIFWNQGEPFLHKDILSMFDYCSKKNIFTITSTNANYIPDPESVVKSGLKTLIISLDGATQETYNKYRINGDIDKVISNTLAVVAAKKKFNSKYPLIKWQFIVMKHNENELVLIKKLAQKIGVDSISFKTVQIYDKNDIVEFLPSNPKFRRYRIHNDNFVLKKNIANRCRRIFTQPVINWDGEMAVCCFDKDNLYKVGNLREESLISLWKSTNINRIRQLILTNRKQIPICLNCGEGVKLSIKEIS